MLTLQGNHKKSFDPSALIYPLDILESKLCFGHVLPAFQFRVTSLHSSLYGTMHQYFFALMSGFQDFAWVAHVYPVKTGQQSERLNARCGAQKTYDQ